MTRIALVSPFTLPFPCGNSILAERLQAGLHKKGGYEVALYDCRTDAAAPAARFAPHLLHSINAERPYQWVQEFLQGKKVPWVITLTGTDYNVWCGSGAPPVPVLESLGRADALVVFHEDALQTVRKCLPAVAGKIHIIAQGVTPAVIVSDVQRVRQHYGISPETVLFLMVAGIRPVKNIAVALEAFAEVEKNMASAVLLLAGPVIDRSEAERVFSLGSRLQRFRYLGEIAPAAVRELMAAADVFLNTSLHEGMSGSVLEAMAAGLPVVASAVAGNCALVRDNENGLLFSGDDPRELIIAAVRLSMDRPLRSKLGHAGKKMVAAAYSAEQEIEKYEHLYRSLLK
ncbi:MAG: glycosyltransferase [Proteobacteria bacterium]|nr:glycosyltransferase [Pseudomonadota bacterium]